MAFISSPGIDIKRNTSGPVPDLPFKKMKEYILGKKYQLSLIFPAPNLAIKLHATWKNKPGPANILSFPIDNNTGEIFISLAQARREHKKYSMSYSNYLAYLFIHGLLHLKGYDHGSRMEAEEQKALRHFKFTD